jgi:MFS family permease
VAEPGRPPYGLLALLAVYNFLSVVGEYGARTFFNVYLDAELGVPTAQIGVLLGIGHLVSVLCALAAPIVMARWGRYRTLLWGTLAVAVALLPLALIPHVGGAALGYSAVVGVAAVTRAANSIFMMAVIAHRWRPTMTAWLTMGSGSSGAAVGLAGGFAIGALGYASFFLTGAGLTALGALLLWAVFRARRAHLANAADADLVD